MARLALYIARRMLPWIAAALAAAVLLFVATQLLRIAPILAGAEATGLEMARAFGLLVVPVLGFALPPSFAIAAFAVAGSMAEDGELNAIDAAGIPRISTASGPLVVAVFLFAVNAFVWLVASPAACAALRDDALRIAARAAVGRVTAGRFSEPMPGVVVYADAAAGGEFEGVIVDDSRDPRRPVRIFARKALVAASPFAMEFSFEGGEAFLLASGEDGTAPLAAKFETLRLDVPFRGAVEATESFLPAALATSTGRLLGPPPPGVSSSDWSFAFTRRLGSSVGFLVLALVSTALAFRFSWGHRSFAIACFAVLFAVFHVAGRAGERLLSDGVLDPFSAAFLPSVGTVVGAVLMLAVARMRGLKTASSAARKSRCSKRSNGV